MSMAYITRVLALPSGVSPNRIMTECDQAVDPSQLSGDAGHEQCRREFAGYGVQMR
jgi:hypothetical protein